MSQARRDSISMSVDGMEVIFQTHLSLVIILMVMMRILLLKMIIIFLTGGSISPLKLGGDGEAG